MKRVAILIGSASDWPKMEAAAAALGELGIEYHVEVTSAHRTPERTAAHVASCDEAGIEVYIVGAGAAAHLAGAVAAHTTRPVIGVPVNATSLQGLDALLATVQMPAGVPVATMAVDGSRNAGLLAAQILALGDPGLREALQASRAEMRRKVEASSVALKERLG